MKPKITARSLRRWWLLVLALFGLALAACTGVRSRVATTEPGLPLTQTAARVPTRYITFTPSLPLPTPTPRATTKPTQSPSSAYTQTPRPSLSAVAWSVAATDVDVSSLEYGLFSLQWQSDVVVEINGDYIDARTGEVQQSQPTEEQNVHKSYSPDDKYMFRCDEPKLRLYRVERNQLLGEANFDAPCDFIDWRDDSSAASIGSEIEGGLYIWRISDSAPTKIRDGFALSRANWSPDGQRLAFGGCDLLEDKAYCGPPAERRVKRILKQPPAKCRDSSV